MEGTIHFFFFYKNIFYKNIQAENGGKIKYIVAILYLSLFSNLGQKKGVLIRKKARKAMPFLWLFSFRAGNRVSIFAWERFGDLSALLYHNEAVHGTNANLKPTHPANFMQNFKSLGLLVLRIYPIK